MLAPRVGFFTRSRLRIFNIFSALRAVCLVLLAQMLLGQRLSLFPVAALNR